MELPTIATGEGAAKTIFVIRLEGEFDLTEGDRIRDAFNIAQSASTVVVDLEKATYIDSTILANLLDLRKATQQRGASLFLVRVHPAALRLLGITALAQLFDIRRGLRDVPDADVAEMRRLTIESRSST